VKQVNQLIHSTKRLETLKSILKNGLHTSYAKEEFCGENILIPMISFSNLLFRDLGSEELVSYGNYGIVINRDLAYEKYNLNPVMYVTTNSKIAKSVDENFEHSVLPQALNIIKQFYIDSKNCCGKFSDNVNISHLNDKTKYLINSIDENTSDNILDALREIFGDIFVNSNQQILLMKPYKVKDGKGKEWIAYNDREWRKSFPELNFISEFSPRRTGERNAEYDKWLNTQKPHYTDEKYTLKIDISEIEYIIVAEEKEIEEIENFIKQVLGKTIEKGKVDILENLKKKEKDINSFIL